MPSNSYLSDYSDDDEEELLFHSTGSSRPAPAFGGGGGGGGPSRSGRGRPGGGASSARALARARASNGHVRSRVGALLDGDEELLAAERQTNCWLTVAVVGLLAACGFLLYDRVAVERGAAGHTFIHGGPSKLNGGKGKAAAAGGTTSGGRGWKGTKEHGFQDPDDDWYDDKFQREVPKKASTVTASQLAKGGEAINKKTTKEEEKRAKELIKRIYNDDAIGEEEESEGTDEGDIEDRGKSQTDEAKPEQQTKPELEPNTHTPVSSSRQPAASASEEREQSMARLSTYAPWNVPYNSGTDLPIFWHVPLSAGTTLEDILSHCYGLVEANEIGVTMGHDADDELMILKFEDGGQYVNVDSTTQGGIARAKELGLASSDLADVVLTPYLHDAADLFRDTSRRGKCLTLLRHPVERAISMFYYLKSVAPPESPLHDMSVEEYADSQFCEENWMVRFLVDQPEGVLKWHHLDLAKEVLGRKCLVGLVEEFRESLRRFEKYFGWDVPDESAGTTLGEREDCEAALVQDGDNRHEHPTYEKGSEVYQLLERKNGYDLMLFEYAKELWEKQALYTDSGRGLI